MSTKGSDGIYTVQARGRTRYRAVVDIGPDPVTGRRRQKTATFDTRKEAKVWRATTTTQVSQGSYIAKAKDTLGDYLEHWVESRVSIRPTTRRNYQDALRPFVAELGAVPLDRLQKKDVEAVRDKMLTGELRRVGKKGKPLSARSVRLALGTLTKALEDARKDEKIVRNFAALVERPTGESKHGVAWSLEQAMAFRRACASDRLHAVWLLGLDGLRRGELLGLRWSSVDLEEGTITISEARVYVAGEVMESGTKTRRGVRTLPVSDEVLAALKALKATQAKERLEAGSAYVGEDYVARDRLGRALHPEWFSDEFRRLTKAAGLPVIRLHDLRHTSVTLRRAAGYPDRIVAAWHGHDETVMRRTYDHIGLDDLRASQDPYSRAV